MQSFLQSVRLHPQLVLGSQQWETSTSRLVAADGSCHFHYMLMLYLCRWRGFDAQAIEVECSKVSIDSNVGCREHAGDPLTDPTETSPRSPSSHSSPYLVVPQSIHPHNRSTAANPGVQRFEPNGALVTEGDRQSSLPPAVSSNQFWSPTIALGLATPPPSRSISPSGSNQELSSFMASRLGDDFSQRSTPATTPGSRGTPRTLPETESLASTTSGLTPSSSAVSSTRASRRGSAASSTGRQSPTKFGQSPSQSRKLLFSVKHGAEPQLSTQTLVEESDTADDRSSRTSIEDGMVVMSSSPKVILDPDRKEAAVVYGAVYYGEADSTTLDSNRADVSKPESVAVLPNECSREENKSTVLYGRSRHLSLSHWMDGMPCDDRQSHHSDTKARLLAQIRLQAGTRPVPRMGHHLRASSVDFSHSLPTLAAASARHRSTDDINKTLESRSVPPDSVARPAHLWKGVGSESCSVESLPDMTMLKKRHEALFSPVCSKPAVMGPSEQSTDSSQNRDGKSSAQIEVGQELHSSELVTEVFSLDESVEAVHVCGTDSLPHGQDDNNDDNDGDEPSESDREDYATKQSVSFGDASSPRTVVQTFSHMLPSALPVPAFLSQEVSKLEAEQRPVVQGNESGTGLTHPQFLPAEILDRLLELGSAMHAKQSSWCVD